MSRVATIHIMKSDATSLKLLTLKKFYTKRMNISKKVTKEKEANILEELY